MSINKGLFTSNTDLWATPQAFYDRLDSEFNFALDPCSNEENHKCWKYFTIGDNGLTQDWAPFNTFMNPPYGRAISDWIKKAYEESIRGTTVVCLIPARTDTKYWHDYVMKAKEIRFVKGRLKFGDSKNSAPFPSAVVVFQEHDGGMPKISAMDAN